MKAITIRQPWAHMTLLGIKLLEFRPLSWLRARYRGPLYIHAGAKAVPIEWRQHARPGMVFGALICMVDLVDIRLPTKRESKAWNVSSVWDCALVLQNVRPIKPVFVKGQLGLWNYEPRKDGNAKKQ